MMSRMHCPVGVRRTLAVLLVMTGAQQVNAQQLALTDAAVPTYAAQPLSTASNALPASSALPMSASQHPLAPVLKYAREEQAYLQSAVRDFTCRLVKRERIEGKLQDFHFIDMRVREEVRDGDRVSKPLSIFLQFLAPSDVAGRKVLYVAGQNDGKMLVRKGGKRFEYVVVEVDPDGDNVRSQSLVPITQSGFSHVLGHMINVLEAHVKADPAGDNTKVHRISAAKVNHRPCTVMRIVHPKKQPGLEFYIANVFVDDQLHVPVRVDFSSWPEHSNQAPPLIAEYTYTDLKINVNLPDGTFDPALLRKQW